VSVPGAGWLVVHGLHRDRDFDALARISPLEVERI
jgi:hypothetical protein